ncbi:MAG: DUF481 domain-containing protein [Fimbriimonadaceae bacterium]|nr:DUF481 domain-containing protein [Chthonomonadaceae bacterium]MCO5296916.1 DUF481 domain-containing protein [Fimbriimonadaceae bacterium]
MLRLHALALFAAFSAPLAARADVITLLNGDRITGRVVSLVEGKLRVATDFAGTLMVDAGQVEAVRLDDEATIDLRDGRQLRGTLVPGPGGTLLLRVGGNERQVGWDDVLAINAPPPARPQWKGSVVSNLNLARSNTDTQVFNVDLETHRKGPSEETDLSGSYLFGQQTQSGEVVTTQDSWGVSGHFSRYASSRTSSFLSARLERDGIVDLDLRSIVGGGLGFMLLERGDTKWWIDLGVSHLREDFAGAGAARERLTGQFSYRFQTRLFGRVELGHEVSVYPALDNVSDYFLSSKFTVRTPLSQTLFANFRFVLDYDATPAPGSRKDSSKYTFGIGYRF